MVRVNNYAQTYTLQGMWYTINKLCVVHLYDMHV